MTKPKFSELSLKASKFILEKDLLKRKEAVLLGLSGGPDSLALLYILKEIQRELELKLAALYVDHGLRPKDTPQETEFCKNQCQSIGVDFFAEKVDVQALKAKQGLSTQEAARHLRLAALEKIAEQNGIKIIALAHNAEDQAETILLNILRGTGKSGLIGMKPLRISKTGFKIIRPLLKTTRSEIINYLDVHKIHYLEDPSNYDLRYKRSRLRHEVIPILLKHFNPRLIETLEKLSNNLAQEEQDLDFWVDKEFSKVLLYESAEDICLDAAYLRKLPNFLQIRIFQKLLRNKIKLEHTHLKSLVNLLHQPSKIKFIDLPKNLRAFHCEEKLHLIPKSKSKEFFPEFSFSQKVNPEGKTKIPELHGEILIEKGSGKEFLPDANNKSFQKQTPDRLVAFLDEDCIKPPLFIRNWQFGDTISPLGMAGQHKKVQDIFVDQKVSRNSRPFVPILADRESIIWIIGFTINHLYRVREDTKAVLKATWHAEKNSPKN